MSIVAGGDTSDTSLSKSAPADRLLGTSEGRSLERVHIVPARLRPRESPRVPNRLENPTEAFAVPEVERAASYAEAGRDNSRQAGSTACGEPHGEGRRGHFVIRKHDKSCVEDIDKPTVATAIGGSAPKT